MTKDQIRDYLAFYRDLGFDSIYTSLPRPKISRTIQPAEAPAPAKETTPPAVVLPGLAPEGDTLDMIRLDIGDCTRCRLHEKRMNVVFGSGNEKSRLVFVGEGPGADEDESGLPFVGRAGQLLTQMIDNTASKEGIPITRADVYICNVVKCRPPENRTPLPDEMQTCGQFLFRQLMAIKPKAICALGSTAMKALLNSKEGITKLRGPMADMARHSRDGDVSSFLSAAPIQSDCAPGSLGRSEDPAAFRL